MTTPDRDFETQVTEYLAKLDGSTASSVSLLTGIPVDELDEYGGLSEETDGSGS